jgi:hypothetical protein
MIDISLSDIRSDSPQYRKPAVGDLLDSRQILSFAKISKSRRCSESK